MYTPSFIFSNSLSERMPRVSGVRGQFREMTSDCPRSSSKETKVAPRVSSSERMLVLVGYTMYTRTFFGQRLSVVIENLHIPRLGLLGHALTNRTYFKSVTKLPLASLICSPNPIKPMVISVGSSDNSMPFLH